METIKFEGVPRANKGGSIEITRMPLNKIKTGRNSRATVDKTEIDGLMESIKSVGLLQPIGVVKNPTGGYDIAYGNRRFLACSKLGMSHMPVIVHQSKKAADIDIKNLAENVQRKSISLTEVGRYVSLLKGEGLTTGEIAIRLGVPRGYVDTCEKAFSAVPKEFRNDLVSTPQGKAKHQEGKIPASTAMKVLSAVRSYKLDGSAERKLFKAARDDEKFEPSMIAKYARQLKGGNESFVKTQKPLKHIRLQFVITQDEYDKIQVKYVDDGPFRSVSAVMVAALMGKVSLTVNVVNDK